MATPRQSLLFIAPLTAFYGEVAKRVTDRVVPGTQPTPELVDKVRMELQHEHYTEVKAAIELHAPAAARNYKVQRDDVIGAALLQYAKGCLLRRYNPARASLRAYLNPVIWRLASRQPGAVLPQKDGCNSEPANSGRDDSRSNQRGGRALVPLSEVEDQLEALSDRAVDSEGLELVREWLKKEYPKPPELLALLIASYSGFSRAELIQKFPFTGTPQCLSRLLYSVKRKLRERFNPDSTP